MTKNGLSWDISSFILLLPAKNHSFIWQQLPPITLTGTWSMQNTAHQSEEFNVTALIELHIEKNADRNMFHNITAKREKADKKFSGKGKKHKKTKISNPKTGNTNETSIKYHSLED